ncbi:MAG TPA: heme ABC exporter ATP-binding protein CcmA, partial [Burkholderiales bacterium]|nr:heme ABC exporter ATP-binding protein CcmA [Burkholderiales bacterium]
MLEVVNVACVRGDRTLFSDVSFTLARGALLHVAGANGSGKTSLLRIICCLLHPANGEVRWSGGNVHSLAGDYWTELAYIGHTNALKDDLTAAENLEIGAALRGRTTTRETALAALDRLGVSHCANLPVRVLSQGQRRRVTL